MKSFAALIAALGFVASSAFAETAIKSQYFYQTAADKNQGTADLGYSTMTSKYKNGNQNDAKLTVMPLTLRYERGLSDMFSVGAQLGYALSGGSDTGGGTTGDKYDVKGMSDLVVYMRGQYGVMSNMSIHYGVDLNASLGKRKIKNGTGTEGQTEDTLQSGGMGLMPYIGMAYAMDAHIIGARFTTAFDLGKRKVDNAPATGASTSYEYTGGLVTKLAAFYETTAMGSIVGAELYYAGYSTTKATNTTANPNTETKTDGTNNMGLNLYGVWSANESLDIIGRLGYDWSLASTAGASYATAIDSTNAWNIGVAGRYTF